MSQAYSVVFAGTPEFALPSLEALIADPAFEVKLVISQPDRPVGRKQILTPPPVKDCAKKHGMPTFQPEDMNKQYIEEDLTCDFLVVVAYGQIFSKEILNIPSIAPVNVHASLLPRWRGASPIQHALLAGDTQTGVTIQKMSEVLDTGDILTQCSTPIEGQETIASLHDRLSALGAELLLDTLKKPLSPTPQSVEKVTTCSKLTRADGDVDSEVMTAGEIDLRVRALVPWPGVRCNINGTEVKLIETSLQEIEDALALPCAKETTLFVQTLQPSGKKPMSGKSWTHGRQK